jgi:hypothetical protein
MRAFKLFPALDDLLASKVRRLVFALTVATAFTAGFQHGRQLRDAQTCATSTSPRLLHR